MMNGYVTANFSVSFDSSGVGFLLSKLQRENNAEHEHYNFVTSPNIVNVAGDKYGKWFRIFTYHVSDDATSLDTVLGFAYPAQWAGIVAREFVNYDLYNHSMKNILRSIDRRTGIPYLLASVEQWPSLNDYQQ